MKEEIKEIIESSRKIIKSNRENGFDRIIMLGDDIDKLLDYITNLQEENERYKRIFEGKERFSKIMPDDIDFIILSKADYDRQQEDIELNAIELKSRIDKAIEYMYETLECNYHGANITFDELIHNTEDILKGENK